MGVHLSTRIPLSTCWFVRLPGLHPMSSDNGSINFLYQFPDEIF
jgi:hypothetical protein